MSEGVSIPYDPHMSKDPLLLIIEIMVDYDLTERHTIGDLLRALRKGDTSGKVHGKDKR